MLGMLVGEVEMIKRFNDPELQRQWEEYQDYLASHYGQAYKCMSFNEWKQRSE